MVDVTEADKDAWFAWADTLPEAAQAAITGERYVALQEAFAAHRILGKLEHQRQAMEMAAVIARSAHHADGLGWTPTAIADAIRAAAAKLGTTP